MSYRSLWWTAALALATLGTMAPSVAHAQFTTFIPPQNKTADSVKAAVATTQKAASDSLASMRLTNMKTWVDSAAGVMPPATTAADSAAEQIAATTAADTLRDTSTFVSGARAPETASDLPLLLVAGAAAFAAGLVLIATAPRPRAATRRDRA